MTAPKKNQSLKCSQQVRNIPLERYRLSTDGRKWKQAARGRSGLLLRLSSYANGDGTFVRNGRNYSPSLKTLLNHVGHGSYYRLVDDLRSAGLLSWTREKHYERRIYTIHIPESGPAFDPEQIPDSEITGPAFDDGSENQVPHSQDQVPHSPEQVPHSQITGPTSDNHPSLPSGTVRYRQREGEPSNATMTKPSLSNVPPAAALNGNSNGQPGGQEKAQAVDYVIGLCLELTGKGPKPSRVDALLSDFLVGEIEDALRDYTENKSDEDLAWAERKFFEEGVGRASILARRRRDWESELDEEANYATSLTAIDDFVAANPAPSQMLAADVVRVTREAKQKSKRVIQKSREEKTALEEQEKTQAKELKATGGLGLDKLARKIIDDAERLAEPDKSERERQKLGWEINWHGIMKLFRYERSSIEYMLQNAISEFGDLDLDRIDAVVRQRVELCKLPHDYRTFGGTLYTNFKNDYREQLKVNAGAKA